MAKTLVFSCFSCFSCRRSPRGEAAGRKNLAMEPPRPEAVDSVLRRVLQKVTSGRGGWKEESGHGAAARPLGRRVFCGWAGARWQWPMALSYGLVLCPMALSYVLWPCPMSCGLVLCPMALSYGPVLCPIALSYVLSPCPMSYGAVRLIARDQVKMCFVGVLILKQP